MKVPACVILLVLLTAAAGLTAGETTWLVCSTEYGDLPVPNSGGQQTASLVLDLDKDGTDDFLITERTESPSVVWYKYSGNQKWTRFVVDAEPLRIEAGGAFFDIDGDGDQDVVFAGDARSNGLWWWENPYPEYKPQTPWKRHTIKSSGGNKHHDQVFGDFDGDGRVELASWNQRANHLLLFEIPDNPKADTEWQRHEIFECTPRYEGIAAADLDLDGKTDIAGAGRWFRHEGGQDFSVHTIDPDEGREFTRCAVGQLIPGGRPEVVLVPGDASGPLKWYEWKNDTWLGHQLHERIIHGHSIAIRDIDKDGHLDIFVAEMGKPGAGENARTFIYRGDSKGNFVQEIVAVGLANHESKLGDLDGDGDIDILVKPYSYNAPALHVLLQGEAPLPLDRWQRHLVDAAMPHKAVFIHAADMNGDSRKDIIAGGWWWQNPGSLGKKWSHRTIGIPLNNAFGLHDFDNDGDMDIIGTRGFGSEKNHTFAWAVNDGNGSFTIATNIQEGLSGDFIQGRGIADFGKGVQVILSWHRDSDGIHALNVPEMPVSTQWPIELLTHVTQEEDISIGDIDRDGDLDMLLGTQWLENADSSWKMHVLGRIDDLDEDAEPDRNNLADVNGDGRLDAIVSLEKGTALLWFEAPQDPSNLWSRHLIEDVPGQGFSLDVADFDRDNDPDIVLGEHRGSEKNRVLLFENRNKGAEWRRIVVDEDSKDTVDHHDGTQAVDIDGDGDMDIISIGWYNPKVWVFENKAKN
jgi:hypothetical protein